MKSSSNPLFYGWWNVLVAFNGMALSYAMFTVFTFGTFVRPLEQEFGWARGEISFALTMTNLAVVLASPSIGSLLDRFGVRAVLIPSTALMGLAVASMALLGGELWHFYAMYLLIPIVGAGTLPQSYSRVIINWFHRRRGIALGIALSGFGVGAALVPVCAEYLIEHFGWRTAYLAFGAAILGISLPLTLFLMRETPREMGLETDGGASGVDDPPAPDSGLSMREAAETGSFWLIFGSFLLVGVAITSILAHLVPMLIGRGVTPESAARCMSLLGIGLILGRVISGFLMDRFFAPHVTAFFLMFLFTGVVILALGLEGPAPFLAALMVGLATGSEISEIAYLCSRYFGPRGFCLIYGTMFAAFQIGSAFGPPLMGLYYDHSGNYVGMLWLLSGLVLVGTLLIVRLGPYPAGYRT